MMQRMHVMSVVGLNARAMNIWLPKCELSAMTLATNANSAVVQTQSMKLTIQEYDKVNKRIICYLIVL